MLLAPPSEPKDINITELTDSIVVVAWSPPADNGGRNDVKYDVQCTTCSNSGSCSKYCNGAQFWPGSVDLTSLQVTITGLNSDTVYNISVIFVCPKCSWKKYKTLCDYIGKLLIKGYLWNDWM